MTAEMYPFAEFFADPEVDARAPGIAWLDKWALSEWSRAEGYRRAAELLVEQAKSVPRSDSDRLIFPIIFLFRQALELKLKEFMSDGMEFSGGPVKGLGTHDLRELWDRARKLVDDCPVGISEPYLPAVERAVNSLHAVDKAATAFRYPFNLDGTPNLPEDLKVIDPGKVGALLGAVIDIFDGWITGIYESSQNRSQARVDSADPKIDKGGDK